MTVPFRPCAIRVERRAYADPSTTVSPVNAVNQRTRIIAGGIIAVLLFDLVASLAARSLGFPYATTAVGMYFIYLVTGFLAGRAAATSRAKEGAIAAALAGFADASAGWAMEWIIGVGRPPSGTLTPTEWIITAAIAVLFAAGIGFLGGAVGARSNPHVAR
jgi:hypothetical protein